MARTSLALCSSAALRSGKTLSSAGSRRPRWARLPGSMRKRAARDLAIALPYQIVEFRMPSHEAGDERTARHDFEVLRPGRLQRGAHEPRTDAPAPQGRRHLGMGEGDDARFKPVVGDCGVIVGVHLEAVLGLVVADNVRHADLGLVRWSV